VTALTAPRPAVRRGTGHDGTVTAPATDAVPVLQFRDGLPGFPDAHRFRLEPLDPTGTLFALRSVEQEGLRFLLLAPGTFFPGYAVELDDDTVGRLGLTTADDALVLLVVTPGEGVASATANLLAPVVVNQRTAVAAQVVLGDADLSVAAPLVR
jgi:flagellar assembly factor FliW